MWFSAILVTRVYGELAEFQSNDAMSINNIQKLKQFGIFQNHTNNNVRSFGKYNLFYGWNGSGKSTLSGVFRCIENRAKSVKFPSSEIAVGVNGGSAITHNNIDECDLNVYTFNQDFISENISWNSVVKSILLIDKEKIAERKKLEILKEEQKSDSVAYSKEADELEKLEKAISRFGTEGARHLKTSLQSIDTTDNHYLNYNKTKFESFIAANIDKISSTITILDDAKIIELTNAAKPNQKDVIDCSLQTIDQATLAKAGKRLVELLQTSVISKTIQRLIGNADIASWVEAGIDLHKRHDVSQCEFCGSNITDDRVAQLEAHFNDDYKAFQDRLVNADKWLADQKVQVPVLPGAGDLYEELKTVYSEACTALEIATESLNGEISSWHAVLNAKISNPLERDLTVESIRESSITAYNKAIASITKIIGKHNHKTANFKEETNKAKKMLELHFASAEVKNFDYHKKKSKFVERKASNSDLKTAINKRNTEIRAIEESLSNEGLGADQFNEALHKFLGRSELTLRFNPGKKGYEIIRNATNLVEGNLSEGEKTAVAFVYFITKLKENGNKIEETIVVVDDPVSSFDSNHLFHAYSFLRSNCDQAKQLFVFTHNFTYFKLIRDWFEGVNRNRKSKNPPRDPNAFFYSIEASTSVPRHSTFKNADSSLVKYNSEYHYIFSKLYAYKNNPSLTRDEAFLTANLARKLLESFFTFKFPKYRSDVSQLMRRGLIGCETTDEVTKEKIYRFINKYSHSVVIDINEDSSENLVGESKNVIGDIFVWLEEVDEVHYKEMVEVIS